MARLLMLLVASAMLSGCTVALHGHESAGAGATGSTASALRVQAGGGTVRVNGGFGAPAPRGTPGVQASFSRGASAVLIVGLVVAEALHHLGAQSSGQPAPGAGPQRAISHTCSCYGYKPPESPAPQSAQ